MFGSMDNWHGLGVFFDSFDNDGLHNNPYVSVMLNDGTKSYDHETYATTFCIHINSIHCDCETVSE